MTYSFAKKLIYPLKNYHSDGLAFGKECARGEKYWGIHLGEDALAPAGTEVWAIGRGYVVYSAVHPGTKEKPNWGNIIIIAHENPKTGKTFFSLYAHLGVCLAGKGKIVEAGDIIGMVGRANTPENGWWKDEHLHFAIYSGPWEEKVLPGYWKREDARTRLTDWEEPSRFIERYEI